jgi:hypothetical protein
MNERTLSAEGLDDLAAQVIAGIEREAEATAAQPFFESMMEEVEKRSPKTQRYTGAEFFLRQPIKFRAVVGYLAEGRGQLWIADRVQCSHHTVRAVLAHFPKSVAIEKERLADLCQTAATLMVEQIIENPDKVPAQSWGLTAAQLADKAILLRGGASLTIEHKHTFSHGDFNALVNAAPIRDVESECLPMGLTGGENSPMAAPAPARPLAAGAALAATPFPGDPASVDSASPVSQSNPPPATTHATPDQPEAPAPGGEGVADPKAGGANIDAT